MTTLQAALLELAEAGDLEGLAQQWIYIDVDEDKSLVAQFSEPIKLTEAMRHHLGAICRKYGVAQAQIEAQLRLMWRDRDPRPHVSWLLGTHPVDLETAASRASERFRYNLREWIRENQPEALTVAKSARRVFPQSVLSEDLIPSPSSLLHGVAPVATHPISATPKWHNSTSAEL